MAQWWQILLGLWTVLPTLTGDKLLNVCMNSKRHKQEPGPEDKLYLECMPWKDNACCTSSTSWEAHHDEPLLFNFSVIHCGLLTPVCHKHFIQAICFHECSPNLGPWIQPVVPDSQEEQRVWGAPLCQEDCEEWWEACRSSHTCKSNWLHDWNWSQDLCEKIWNDTFKASPERRNSGRCLQKWFEPTHGNPNVEVALHFASSALAPQLSYTLPAFSLCLLLHS